MFGKPLWRASYNPLQKNLVANHKDFHMLMHFPIQKHMGFPHDMTFHTEFHRPLPKMKGGVAFGHALKNVVGWPPPHFGTLSFLFGVCETLYEMSCHV